jgi:UDPglucose--hexose-1-phosphate uridylyltransferase
MRANGERNPRYSSTYVFENDFPAFLGSEGKSEGRQGLPMANDTRAEESSSLLVARNQSGICRVICYSPRHDLTMAQMSEGEIRAVIRLWIEQAAELESRWTWVQVFENKGELMGCSHPHPHG